MLNAYKIADISEECLSRILLLEKELKELAKEDIVLIAYAQEEPK